MNELKTKLLGIIAELNEAATLAAKTKREKGLAAGLPMLGLATQLNVEAGHLVKIVRDL